MRSPMSTRSATYISGHRRLRTAGPPCATAGYQQMYVADLVDIGERIVCAHEEAAQADPIIV